MDAVIELEGVWKVFGPNPDGAIADARAGQSKAAILARHKAVVGIADASFSVRRGEIFCIMGLSGSGKSTLVRHVNRLIEPTAGDVRVLGRSVLGLGRAELRDLRARRIGMVFQHMALLPHRTVRDNVAYPLEIRRDPKAIRWRVSREKLALVGLEGYEDRFPRELSGGMQQRVGLARALASDPEILLMDEPFSALDPLIRKQLQDQFLDLSRRLGKTTLFITHDLGEAIRLGDRIAIMKDGQIIQVGPPAEILLRPADDYVRDFVKDISRLGLITAAAVMEPSDAPSPPGAAAEPAHDGTDCAPDDGLDRLIELMVGREAPLVVRAEDGRALGAVTKDGLLRAIRDGK
jgi:glycine betaine/proline transport system ATP-binding protein